MAGLVVQFAVWPRGRVEVYVVASRFETQMHAQVFPWVSGWSSGVRRLLGLGLRLGLHLDLRLWLGWRRWRSLVLVVDLIKAPALAVRWRLWRLRLGEGRRGRIGVVVF